MRPELISTTMRARLGSYDTVVDGAEVGQVISVGDGIARVSGVESAVLGEMLAFAGGFFGIALNLEEDRVGVVLLGESSHVKEGDVVRRTGRLISVPVGDAQLGRVVNALGQPLDGKGRIATLAYSSPAAGRQGSRRRHKTSLMKRRIEGSMARQRTSQGDEYGGLRMKWGLSSRLPRWRTFDGRRSQLAPRWAQSEPAQAR